jgi:CHAT domain-containing protein
MEGNRTGASLKDGVEGTVPGVRIVTPFRPGAGWRAAVTRRTILLTLLIAVAAIAAATFLPWPRRESRAGLQELIAEASSGARDVEPRLTGGFAWAPYRAPRHDRAPASLRLASALGSLASEAPRGDVPARDRHTAGVAHLLAGRTREALTYLSMASQGSSDANVWCDLAAARYSAAVELGLPEMFAESLAAADAALALEPGMPEALFNRALALESLGLRDDARAAWTRYLADDVDTAWAAEARQHVALVAPEEAFSDVLDRDYDSLTSGDVAARALARRYPQEARTWGEARILGRWAAALLAGEPVEAERHLRLARAFGAELVQINGDRMLERGVAAIDGAGDAQRTALATGHAALTAAHDAFNANRPAEAEAKFRAAGAALENGGSPIALVARYYEANAVYEQGRSPEALQILEPLLAALPQAYSALRAQALWEVALCHGSGAHWGAMLDALNDSAAIFDRLGETAHATVVRGIVAAVYDRIGDPGAAWTYRMAALRGVGRRTTPKLQQVLAGVAQAAMLRQNWRTAAAFLNLEIEIGRRVDDDYLYAEALLIRAPVRQRLSDDAGARADLAEAAAVIARMEDASIATRLRAEYAAVQAMLEASPVEAVTLATQAIEFHEAKGYRMLLPNLYLQRARAYRDSGDPASAARDLERGISELESHRESLPEGEARWGVFHSADELFEDAIALALRRNDARAAFAIVERARARALLDSYGETPGVESWDVPAGTAIVEYASLPTQLVIFTVDGSGIRATALPCDRNELAQEAKAFAAALSSNDRVKAKSLGRALYRRAIAPVENQLAGSGMIAFVADGALATIPFGALVDGEGKYLLEKRAVILAPSAAVFTATARRRTTPASPGKVLVVASDAAASREALRFVKLEAEKVADTYPSAIRLDGKEARIEALIREAASSSTIHFAGHAMGDAAGLEPASIVLSDGRGGERRVGVSEIARLHLRRNAVVVLAGCATAVGERRSPEGAVSVAHGFLAAGAATVIATLWSIDDADAAAFFPRLHARLHAGMSPAEALRAVQLEEIEKPGAPLALWAAVQVIGS